MLPGIVASGSHAAAGNDTYIASRVLAMHMDDTGLTDEEGHTVTLNGGAARSATDSKFGGYSAYFDGTGDYLSVSASTDFDLGTGDFSIDFWINFSSVARSQDIASHYIGGGTPSGWAVRYVYPGYLRLVLGADVVTDRGWTPSTGTWYFVEICRIGTSLKFFINGTQLGATATSSTSGTAGSSTTIQVGRIHTLTTTDMTGYIDDLRVTKAGRHSSDYSVPTAAFPDF